MPEREADHRRGAARLTLALLALLDAAEPPPNLEPPNLEPQRPAWLKEIDGIETYDADERDFIEDQAQRGLKHAEIVRALDERRRGRGAAGGSPVTPRQPPATPSPPQPALPTPRDGVIGGKPVGEPQIDSRANSDKQESLRLQAASEDAMAAAGYRVERSPVVRPDERLTIEEDVALGLSGPDPTGRIGPKKNPDDRIGGLLADVVAPSTPNLNGVRIALSRKIKQRQAYRLVLNLGRTRVNARPKRRAFTTQTDQRLARTVHHRKGRLYFPSVP